jgi:hypothetical protein
MDYGKEPWIKVYTRDTGGWSSLSWQARGLALELSLGTRGLPALAGLLRASWSEIEPFVTELVNDGRLVLEGTTLRDPEHVERQLARTSDAMRKKMQRDREALSQSVTRSHAESQDVTASHTESRIDQKRSDQKRSEIPPVPSAQPPRGDERTEPKRRRPRVQRPQTACPPFAATEAEVSTWAGTWNLPVEHPEFVGFLRHHRKVGSMFSCWSSAWATWLRKAPEFAAKRQRYADTRQPLLDVANATWLKAGGDL